MQRDGTSAQTVQRLVDNPSPDVLAVHAVYCWEATESFFQMLSDLRSNGFDAPICLYGFFPGLVWKEILDYCAAVDYVIVGEPEETMVDLARCIEAGIKAQVEGVALRSHGKASFPRMRAPIESPDSLAFPLRPSLDSEQTVSILASRGCYNHCSFCLVPVLDKGKTMWRGRSPQNVAAEISELVFLGKKDFYFVDPNFVGPGKAGKQTAAKLASQLAGLGITFGMETRANDVTYGLMRELVEAGLTRLLLGIESGRPDVLKRLGKHASIAGNERAIATVRRAGLEPEIGFIMFDAASTLDDIRENLKFLQRNRLVDPPRAGPPTFSITIMWRLRAPPATERSSTENAPPAGLVRVRGTAAIPGFQGGMAGRAYEEDLPFPAEGNGKTFITCLLGGRVCTKRALSGNKRSPGGDLRKAAGFCRKAQLSAGCKLDSGTAFQADG